jgi:hypothetical protein
MFTIKANQTAAQSPSVASVDAAIRNARTSLKCGLIDSAIDNLEKASRRAGDTGDPRATELANFANALAPAFETIELVAMCLRDFS